MSPHTVRRTLIRSLQALALAVLAAPLTQAPAQTAGKPLTILVVGASGMLGSRVAAEATARGHHVIGAARHPEKIAKSPNLKPVKLDATDANALAQLAKDADVI